MMKVPSMLTMKRISSATSKVLLEEETATTMKMNKIYNTDDTETVDSCTDTDSDERTMTTDNTSTSKRNMKHSTKKKQTKMSSGKSTTNRRIRLLKKSTSTSSADCVAGTSNGSNSNTKPKIRQLRRSRRRRNRRGGATRTSTCLIKMLPIVVPSNIRQSRIARCLQKRELSSRTLQVPKNIYQSRWGRVARRTLHDLSVSLIRHHQRRLLKQQNQLSSSSTTMTTPATGRLIRGPKINMLHSRAAVCIMQGRMDASTLLVPDYIQRSVFGRAIRDISNMNDDKRSSMMNNTSKSNSLPELFMRRSHLEASLSKEDMKESASSLQKVKDAVEDANEIARRLANELYNSSSSTLIDSSSVFGGEKNQLSPKKEIVLDDELEWALEETRFHNNHDAAPSNEENDHPHHSRHRLYALRNTLSERSIKMMSTSQSSLSPSIISPSTRRRRIIRSTSQSSSNNNHSHSSSKVVINRSIKDSASDNIVSKNTDTIKATDVKLMNNDNGPPLPFLV